MTKTEEARNQTPHFDCLLKPVQAGDYVVATGYRTELSCAQVLYTTGKMIRIRSIFRAEADEGILVYSANVCKVPAQDVTFMKLANN